MRFVNRDRETGVSKIVGRGKPRRAAADDRDLLGIRRGSFFLRQGQLARLEHLHFLVGGEPFQQPDGDGVIGLAPRAFGLAGMRADPAANGRKRISLADKIDRLEIFLFLDELDVTLDVDPGRALHFAGRVAVLENAENIRGGLGVKFGDALAGAQAAVEFVRDVHGADLRAFAATGAFVLVNIPRMPPDGGLEMARFAFEPDQLGKRQDLDIQVPRAFDELRRDDAGGAIAGREGLVQVRHHAADGGVALDEINLEAAVGQIERRLDAGNAAALHQAPRQFSCRRFLLMAVYLTTFSKTFEAGTISFSNPSSPELMPRQSPRSWVI